MSSSWSCERMKNTEFLFEGNQRFSVLFTLPSFTHSLKNIHVSHSRRIVKIFWEIFSFSIQLQTIASSELKIIRPRFVREVKMWRKFYYYFLWKIFPYFFYVTKIREVISLADKVKIQPWRRKFSSGNNSNANQNILKQNSLNKTNE